MIKLIKKLCRSKAITLDGKPYLTRYYIFSNRFFGLYLHEFHSSDGDRDSHNHPWLFAISFILRGWYIEQRLTRGLSDEYQTSINFIPGYCFHRISDISTGLTTLFFRGPQKGYWGFLRSRANGQVYFDEFKQ